MEFTPELKARLLWSAIAAVAGFGGGQFSPWGTTSAKDETALTVKFTGQARAALAVRDENGQPLVTEQDYSRACMKGIDGEARTRLKEYAEKPVNQ